MTNIAKSAKRVLITGASGFIGGSLFRHLKHMNPIGTRFNSKIDFSNDDFVKVDLRNKNEVCVLFDKYSPEVVFHLAGLSSPQLNENNPGLATEAHLKITNNILNNIAMDTHIIFLSTDKVFDGSQPCPDEESPTNPKWLYGKLKLQCENIIQERLKKIHILRLPIVHSLGDFGSRSIIDKAIIELKAGRPIEVFDNVYRCFVKLQELLELLEMLINDTHYGIYNVGSTMMSYYDRIKVLCEENEVEWRKKLFPRHGQALPMAQNLDTNKLKRTFDYTLN